MFGSNPIQSLLFAELHLQVQNDFIRSYCDPSSIKLNDNKLTEHSPSQVRAIIDAIVKEPFEVYMEKEKNKSLTMMVTEPRSKCLLRDTLFEIQMVLNAGERKDSCASNTTNGCLKFYLSDGFNVFTAIELHKIPNIPQDLKLCRGKKMLVKKNTKLIALKKQPPIDFDNMYLNTTNGNLALQLQYQQHSGIEVIKTNMISDNILSMIQDDDDDDDEDGDGDKRDYGDL